MDTLYITLYMYVCVNIVSYHCLNANLWQCYQVRNDLMITSHEWPELIRTFDKNQNFIQM